MENLKVIDFEKDSDTNHAFTLSYGTNDCTDYWGDDWNDVPYEHNAGSVYDVNKELEAHYNLVGCTVFEPCDGYNNSPYSMSDIKEGVVPCLIIVPTEEIREDNSNNKSKYEQYLGYRNIVKIYLDDSYDEVCRKIEPFLKKKTNNLDEF